MLKMSHTIIFSILLVSGVLFSINNLDQPVAEASSPYVNGCEEFNGRMFFLSGGSLKPTTIEEVNYAFLRDEWLCRGAPVNG